MVNYAEDEDFKVEEAKTKKGMGKIWAIIVFCILAFFGCGYMMLITPLIFQVIFFILACLLIYVIIKCMFIIKNG